jgi:hypothetical protein
MKILQDAHATKQGKNAAFEKKVRAAIGSPWRIQL